MSKYEDDRGERRHTRSQPQPRSMKTPMGGRMMARLEKGMRMRMQSDESKGHEHDLQSKEVRGEVRRTEL